jgi:hypothetical protein
VHVLTGSCEHLVDGRRLTIEPGDTLRIPKGTEHQVRTKDKPFQALIVYDTPNRSMVPVPETKQRRRRAARTGGKWQPGAGFDRPPADGSWYTGRPCGSQVQADMGPADRTVDRTSS